MGSLSMRDRCNRGERPPLASITGEILPVISRYGD